MKVIMTDKLKYYYDKTRRNYEVRMGCISIACIWLPDLRSNRDKYKVRLMFNQNLGQVDFLKDKEFDNIEDCKKYIVREFKMFINDIGYHLGLWKNK